MQVMCSIKEKSIKLTGKWSKVHELDEIDARKGRGERQSLNAITFFFLVAIFSIKNRQIDALLCSKTAQLLKTEFC